MRLTSRKWQLFRASKVLLRSLANVAVRKQPRPVVLVSTTQATRLKENFEMKRRDLSPEAEKAISELEAEGPSVRYDKGIRPEDAARYKLVDLRDYQKNNGEVKRAELKRRVGSCYAMVRLSHPKSSTLTPSLSMRLE